ncbi:uncharacterized protein NEMAJ01_0943 [Nematocida major]|uniref:uncharacterized protein n=1 Tax=Nematocida major TaxID=1912982 RepID=UPI0020086601|nr:uncharacterized protein NEMAJ01_0943 [Nematocida major]KAH9386047.1 hypothetical protein NEMAJ01_0943 [Nematocida major]
MVRLLVVCALLAFLCIIRCHQHIEINPDDFIPQRRKVPGMEHPDSVLDVLEKLLHNFPVLKSKFIMKFQKYINPSSPDGASNPSTYFKLGIGNVPEPDEILKRFQSIIDASSMLKEESRSLIWHLETYADQMFLNEKALIQKANGYLTDMEELIEQHKAETDSLASANIVVKFKSKEKEALKCIKAIKHIRNWEMQINLRLSRSSLPKKMMHIG